MTEFGDVTFASPSDRGDRSEASCREALRVATQGPHERLHLHSGFSMVADGTIRLPDYRALLIRLYGFYLPFERAIGQGRLRTEWLARDLVWLGADVASFGRIGFCRDFPRYDCAEHKLGALYVVEGSALGGRQLFRGLDRLLGATSLDGRRFFAGRGSGTGEAWREFLARLGSAGAEPAGRALLVGAAVETFDLFENWLMGWREI